MTEVLTEKKIRAALAAGVEKRRVLWDGDVTGLGLKLFPSGSASWVFSFRPRGAKRGTPSATLTIGGWPTVRLANARAAARIHAGRIAEGADPAAELREQRVQPRRKLSVALDNFEESLNRRRIVNVKPIMSSLRRRLSPWLAREVETLSRAMIVSRIEALEAEGKPGAASDLRKAARSFLEWCHTQDLVTSNVLSGLRRPRVSRADRLDGEARRGRALGDDEIKMIWAATAEPGSFNGLVRLAMLTGMRRSEVAKLRWADVTADRIVLHAHGTKSGVAHEIPLTIAMREVIAAQPKTTSPLIFPSPRRTASTQLSGWSQLTARLVASSGIDMTLHDLRRTVRTRMSAAGVADEIAELCIGHSRSGLAKIYNRDDAWSRRASAFALISDSIMELVGEGEKTQVAGKIVRLRGS